MKDYRTAIDELKKLDLSGYPREEIRGLIRSLGPYGLVQMVLHPGETIFRARPAEQEQHFNTREELSYKPAKFNKTYQRASTPDQTMFYGIVIPQGLPPEEQYNARIIAALEVCPMLRTPGLDGEQQVTFSRWTVTHDISMLAIVYHQKFVEKSTHTQQLHNAYHQWIKGAGQEMQEKSLFITEFLAGEYAKTDIDKDYKYMISAIFSEIAVGHGQGGIYYPSVRADAKGFNVAITPDVVDKCLRLDVAAECTLYKRGDRTIGDNETVAVISDDSKGFIYKAVDSSAHMGREKVLEEFTNGPWEARG